MSNCTRRQVNKYCASNLPAPRRLYQTIILHLLFGCGFHQFTTTAGALSSSSSSSSAAIRNLFEMIEERKESHSSAIPLMGVHDALSARIFIQEAQRKELLSSSSLTLFVSGFGVSASRLGAPDAGILTRNEMEDAARNIIAAATSAAAAAAAAAAASASANNKNNGLKHPSVPIVMVDGDTGYGGASNIRKTVRGLASIGAAAVSIEDQVFPKKCTYVAGGSVNVIDREAAKRRIQCAVAAKREAVQVDGNDICIIARTDCRNALGLEEAIERCRMFVELGADIVYAEALRSKEEYRQLRQAIPDSIPMILAQVQLCDPNIQERLFTLDEIGEMGYDLALFGVTGLQATVQALQRVAGTIFEDDDDGRSQAVQSDKSSSLSSCSALAPFATVKQVVGFPDLDKFEEEYECE